MPDLPRVEAAGHDRAPRLGRAQADSAKLLIVADSLLLVAACTGGAKTSDQAGPSASPSGSAPTASAGPDVSALRNFTAPRNYQAVAPPVRIALPKIGIDSALQHLGQSCPVILRHVDSKNGAATFYRLRELRQGDQVLVRRADDVYYPTLQPVLRLVTRGGIFDRRVGHYRSNLIAYANACGLTPSAA